jgi:uncharacterized protein (TIGR03086 family)
MGDLIDGIAADQWTAPTPCTEWNVRDLVNHLVGMNLVFVALLEESPMPERGADRLGADPAGACRRSAAALQAAAGRPGVLERSQAPLGQFRGRHERLHQVARSSRVDRACCVTHGPFNPAKAARDLRAGMPFRAPAAGL